MFKSHRLIFALALILVLTLFTSGQTIAQDKGDEFIQKLVDDIKHEVEAIRGLEYIHDVGSKLVTTEELMAYLKGEIEKQLPPEKERAINLVYGQLGLIPSGKGFIETYEALLEDQAGGIYDPDNNQLFVVASNLPGLSEEGEMTGGMLSAFGIDPMLIIKTVIAHELCHALEDQHFHFNDIFKDIQKLSSSDREFAVQCLVEGSATRFMIDHATGGIPLTPFQRNLNRILTNLLTEMSLNVPVYFKRSLTAPYIYGEIFVSRLMENGDGWAEVDKAYANIPISMEQVLHPEKYDVDRDWPSDVMLADFTAVLGEGYEELMQDTLGEFVTDILLDVHLKRQDFSEAPKGWDGDRLMGILGPEDEVTIIWHSVWDTDVDAKEFTDALKLFLGARNESLHQVKSEAYSTGEIYTYTDVNSREYFISRGFDEVIFIDNAPNGMAQTLYDAALAGDEVVRR